MPKRACAAANGQPQIEHELYEQIGRLKMELEWLKKSLGQCSLEQRRGLVSREDASLSLRRPCELLGLDRSGLYYNALGWAHSAAQTGPLV